MNEMLTFPLKLPRHLIGDLNDLAKAHDATPGQILRDLLERELKRHKNAKTPNRADEQLVARFQRLLARDIAAATSWSDLDHRLARKGCVLRPAGGGLVLHRLQDDRRICKASELGFAYAQLVRRFGAPMPGHPHRMAHLFTPGKVRGDFEVIERF